MKGRHDWKWYEAAKEITEILIRSGRVKEEDSDYVRGVVQIKLEEKY